MNKEIVVRMNHANAGGSFDQMIELVEELLKIQTTNLSANLWSSLELEKSKIEAKQLPTSINP
jgi:hypothetical protein